MVYQELNNDLRNSHKLMAILHGSVMQNVMSLMLQKMGQ